MQKRFLEAIFTLTGLIVLYFLVSFIENPQTRINITEDNIKIEGLKKEYRIFLLADSHISLCDQRDQELQVKADERRRAFFHESGKSASGVFEKLLQTSNQQNIDLNIFAGDIIDSAMEASIDYVKGQFGHLNAPYMYVLGNHDFEYGKEYFSKKAYKTYFPRLKPLTGTSDQYIIREYEDLVVIGLNDKNNQLDSKAVKATLPYLRGKKTVILVLHVPLQPLGKKSFLEKKCNELWGLSSKGQCRVLLGESACRPNRTSRQFLKAVFDKNSAVAVVLAGHVHFYNESFISKKQPQYITGAGYYGEALLLDLLPADSDSK